MRASLPTIIAAFVVCMAASCGQDNRAPHPRTDPFRASMPTVGWTTRMKRGDDMFTPQAITASQKRLLRFLDQIDDGVGDQHKLREAFKSVVEDQMNKDYDSFIETSEREELAAYLNAVADAVRFPYMDGDVTEQWRKNW